MKINWLVRLKNKAFWVAIIPAVLLLAQQVCALFGVELNVAGVSDQLIAIVGTAFSILALIGVVNDPTVASLSDSKQAMTYTEPKNDK
jgi:phi LC3 family holin